MKRCPTCNRSYTDDTQKFCLEDGATLVSTSASSFDPQATLAMPGSQPTSPPSNPYGSGQGSSGSGAAPGSFGSGSAQGQHAGSWSPTPSRLTPAIAPPPKKSMLPWILGGAAVLVVGLIGIVIIIAIAVSSSSNKNSNTSVTSNTLNTSNTSNTSNSNKSKRQSTDIVLKSSDGKIQVSTPPSWKIVTDLNDKADLQVSNSAESMYLIVLTDNKADYTSMDLDQHATKTLQTLTNAMTSSNMNDPVRLTIDGNPAVQHEVRGEIKNLNVIYIHTTVETSSSYQQIVVWTLQSSYSKNEDLLKGIVNSFKEN